MEIKYDLAGSQIVFRRGNSVIVNEICIESNHPWNGHINSAPIKCIVISSVCLNCIIFNSREKNDTQNNSRWALNLVLKLWLDRKLMWKEMAQWQTFTINSAMYGGSRCSQQKLDCTQSVLGFRQTMLPSALACSHLVVSIHLHWLIITKQGSPFLHSFPFSPSTALARKELSQLSLCGHPNSEVESRVLQEFWAAILWVSTDLRKGEGGKGENV